MKRFAPLSCPVMVFSLFLVFAIWLTPALAANVAPQLTSLGQLRANGELGAPSAMDLDGEGNLYVADASRRKIYRFDRYGDLVRIYSDDAFTFADGRKLTTGRGLAVTPDGTRVYFARERGVGLGQAFIMDTATGNLIGELRGSGDDPEFKLTGEIEIDAAGNVYVVDAGPGRMVIKIYDRDGNFLTRFGGVGTATGLFQAISSMTIDGKGRIVVADPSPASLSGWVQIFTLDPVTLQVDPTKTLRLNKSTQFGLGPVEYPQNSGVYKLMASELHVPKGVAFDELGRGYFLEYMFSDMRMLDSAENNYAYLGTFWNTGSAQGQLAYVADAVYDAVNRRLFVSCDGGRIEIFGVDGGTSPVYVNTPPTVPALQAPTGGAVLTTDSPVLTYSPATDDRDTATLTYQVVIKQGDVIVHSFNPTPSTSVTVPAGTLKDDILYSWTVQAVDSKGLASGFATAGTFVINTNDPPTIPGNLTPDGSSMVTAAEPVLSYDASLDDYDTILNYQVVVKLAGAEIYSATTTATSVVVPVGVLAENTTYTWSVQATDSKGLSKGFSPAANFVFNAVDEAPSAPVLTTDLAIDALARDRQLAWSISIDPDPNDGIKHYAVELATDAGFADIVDTVQVVDATSLVLSDFAAYPSLTVGASYFCRVTALDQDETSSEPSNAVEFVYDTAVLTVSAPIKGAAVYLGGNLAYPGRPVGVAPLELRDLVPGNYVVAVETPGFATYLENVSFVENGKMSVDAKLLPALQPTAFKGAKAINGKPGLKVSSAAAPFVVDVDADGKTDLLVGDAGGVVHQYPAIQVSEKSGEMSVGAELPILAQLFQGGAVPFVVDWNNDDQSDLLVGLADGTVALNGSPLEAGGVVLDAGDNAAPAVVDYNLDGRKDLVVGNGFGDVVVCYNTGTDDAPQLAAPVKLVSLGVPAVPTAVDWNADGVRELMVASAKGVALYSNENGALVTTPVLAVPAKAVFPVDADGTKGRDLIIGAEDGRLLFAAAGSAVYTDSYRAALSGKVDEIEGLMLEAGEAAAILQDLLATIRVKIDAGSYETIAAKAQELADGLSAADARQSAMELVRLCPTAPAVDVVDVPQDPGTKPDKTAK